MAFSPMLARIRNRAERLRQRPWRTASHRSSERHIVMGGAPRSGTTVLRKLLDRHPQVCAGPETKLFVPAAFNLEWLAVAYGLPIGELRAMRREAASQAAFIDAFAARVRRDSGKERWAEKTPMNIRNLEWIMPRFPRASIVHIVRDGRDVVCSMREHPDWRWRDGAWQKALVPRSLASYARRWLTDTELGLRWRHDPRYVEVRYEQLVADPSAVLRRVCEGIGVRVDAAWLEEAGRAGSEPVPQPDYGGAVSAASVGRWRSDLDAAEQDQLMRLLGRRLLAFGYER